MPTTVSEISDMAEQVQRDGARTQAQSFVDRSTATAPKAVCRADDAVDDLFDVIKGKVTGVVHRDVSTTTANGEQALDLLMVAKYLEKIGDHASNIAEWVHVHAHGGA